MERLDLLKRWLELKEIENKAKEERVALEEQIWIEFEQDTLQDGKLSGTLNEDEFKLTIKLNPKYKIKDENLIPEGVDVYKQVVDEKVLAKYYDSSSNWIEKTWNKPTFNIVKTK